MTWLSVRAISGQAEYILRGLDGLPAPELLQARGAPHHPAELRGRIHHHIIPDLGSIPLNRLTQNDFQQFYVRLKTSGRLQLQGTYGAGLSDRMGRMCHANCRTALEKAVQEELIRVNPAIGCRRKRQFHGDSGWG